MLYTLVQDMTLRDEPNPFARHCRSPPGQPQPEVPLERTPRPVSNPITETNLTFVVVDGINLPRQLQSP